MMGTMRFLVLCVLIAVGSPVPALAAQDDFVPFESTPFESIEPDVSDEITGPGEAAAEEAGEEGEAADEPFLYRAERRRDELDRLFNALAEAPNAVAGKRLAGQIQVQWNQSGSATIDYLMGKAREAMQESRNDVALDLVSEAIALKQDYAEAWNLRATIHFLQGEMGQSMADIERVLALEPRHFGALTGMAAILQQTGRNASALALYERALGVFPTLEPAQEQSEQLKKKLANQTL